MIETVKSNLFRKDSTVLDIENLYRGLYTCEHINEDPEEIEEFECLKIEDTLKADRRKLVENFKEYKNPKRPRFDGSLKD